MLEMGGAQFWQRFLNYLPTSLGPRGRLLHHTGDLAEAALQTKTCQAADSTATQPKQLRGLWILFSKHPMNLILGSLVTAHLKQWIRGSGWEEMSQNISLSPAMRAVSKKESKQETYVWQHRIPSKHTNSTGLSQNRKCVCVPVCVHA